MPKEINVKAGDTEPLDITVSADGLSDLSNVNSAAFYARRVGSTANEVDGASLTVTSTGLTVTLDPATAGSTGGPVFTTKGEYRCYVKLTFTDSDVTRHPGEGYITAHVWGNYE